MICSVVVVRRFIDDASKMSLSDNVTHKKTKDEPSSLRTDSHKDNIYSSLKMSSSDNVTHKKARGEPSSVRRFIDIPMLICVAIPVRNICPFCMNIISQGHFQRIIVFMTT
jgi:hypothetical protein